MSDSTHKKRKKDPQKPTETKIVVWHTNNETSFCRWQKLLYVDKCYALGRSDSVSQYPPGPLQDQGYILEQSWGKEKHPLTKYVLL